MPSVENLELMEGLYQEYLKDPAQLDVSWRDYFKLFDDAQLNPALPSHTSHPVEVSADSSKIERLIDAYRSFGHLFAHLNPIALQQIQEPDEIKWETLGFTETDLNRQFFARGPLKKNSATLNEWIQHLRSIYCDRIGFEYKGLQNREMEQWIERRIESASLRTSLSPDQKRIILESLNRSELFESFLHTKYVGQKRFSLEGAETLIPMLALLIETGANGGVEEFVIGMAHRGRLNVLSNILRKSYAEVFQEFNDNNEENSSEPAGDVKYHKGYTAPEVLTYGGKKIKIAVAPNPSHLESIDPVVEGKTRAKQQKRNDQKREIIIPLLIHGDAALSGQGVVYETLQFYKLPGYTTGGTIHVVINNQIGFTTNPKDLRSTRYCTDIAKTFGVPVFHVNAEDPEGCVLATLLAYEIRQTFHSDVFIELNGYRKYGHNESDEPAFTQPLEYQIIRNKRPIREIYRDQLIQEGIVDRSLVDKAELDFKQNLQATHAEVVGRPQNGAHPAPSDRCPPSKTFLETGVSREILANVAEAFSIVPPGFHIHPKLVHLIKDRLEMVKEIRRIDWGMAEWLAYATLLLEGFSIRISGQDCIRGTFSHRHVGWTDQSSGAEHYPLQHLKDGGGTFEIYNSTLSEFAVLGFEYGYSVCQKEGLTVWEAQFGDFCNGAQVIIDQYIASGEQKWGQGSGLTLYLPHGYEGQGPEHSSGRMERFLALAANNNIRVVDPTTPAQLFHLLRRQTHDPIRKPLIVFTPKGLLRHPACVSDLRDLTQGIFQDVLDDPDHPEGATRLIFCTGRIFYDLIEHRKKMDASKYAIIRIEQLYPLNEEKLREIILSYPNTKECCWVQEEHENMGAQEFVRPRLDTLMPRGIRLQYVGRPRSATPATGSHAGHERELNNILKQVFSS